MFKTTAAVRMAAFFFTAAMVIFASNADAAGLDLQIPPAEDMRSAGPVIPSLVHDDIARELAGLKDAVLSLGAKVQIVLVLFAPVAIVWALDGFVALIFGKKRDRDLTQTRSRFSKPVHAMRLK